MSINHGPQSNTWHINIRGFNKGTFCKDLGGAVTTWAQKDKGSK